MNTIVQTYKPNFAKWESHFKSMGKGNRRKGKIVNVSTANQSGSGVEMVTPSQQVVHMAEGQKKVIKSRKKSPRAHSASGHRRVNISSKRPRKTKKPKQAKKSVKRRRYKK